MVGVALQPNQENDNGHTQRAKHDTASCDWQEIHGWEITTANPHRFQLLPLCVRGSAYFAPRNLAHPHGKAPKGQVYLVSSEGSRRTFLRLRFRARACLTRFFSPGFV